MTGSSDRSDAVRGLQALAVSAQTLDLAGLADRNRAMVRELARFSFPDIAAIGGGLLTYPENQPATFRIEALISLAAVHAKGVDVPLPADIGKWLNGSLLSDPIGQLEDPVEDVFVSNVPYWNGNARLFDGWWGDNDAGVMALMQSVMQLQSEEWAAGALDRCMALLDLSEAIAERAGVKRYTMSPGDPKAAVDVSQARLDEARARVTFDLGELLQLGIEARRIVPFNFTSAHSLAMATQSIGNSDLERAPLIRNGTSIVVVLPTAIGAAIRRHVLETAAAADEMARVEDVVTRMQFSELHEFGLTGFKARVVRRPDSFGPNCIDLVASFDEGAYLHLVYVGTIWAKCWSRGCGRCIGSRST